jgi:hypothetical protein
MLSPFHRWLRLKAIMVTRERIEIALPWREELLRIPRSKQLTVVSWLP